jgi:zinc D-Ala-D-Ala carboxypeptidase
MEEATVSHLATQLGIDNTPPEIIKVEIFRTAEFMERVRDYVQAPIHILSWYRCPLLNEAVKGSSSSQHMTGSAVDFYVNNVEIEELFRQLSTSSIRYDQLIQEHSQWVHISRSDKPRRQRLYATKVNGVTIYTPA